MSADPSPAQPPAEQPAPAPTPAKPVTWPEWFPAFDVALAVMAVVLAFLTASFVARNPDFWRHIATGRLVTQFEYPFGGDPFTFTAAERPWVNPNWVSEVILYAAYSADGSGAVAVGVKAIAYAAAFGLLFLLRKPNFPLWPWAVAAALAVVGGCSQAQLRPYVFGLVAYSAFLVVLFRGDWAKGGKWRMPLILGGVTAVWANVDAFALLAPVSLLLLLAGEAVHRLIMKGADEPAPADDPFPAVPPPDDLLRALGVCVAALLLNPTFLAAAVKSPVEAVAQLVPFELDVGTAWLLAADPDLAKATHGAFRSEFMNDAVYGKNASGVFAAAVCIVGVILSAVGYKAGRVSHLALWLGLVLVAGFLHARFVGPLMLVSVPFLAAHLNALTRRLDLGKLDPHAARGVVTAGRAGRVATAFALILLGTFAVPGWLQIHQPNRRELDRWVAWGVEPEEGIKRAAETIQGWRTDPDKAAALADTRGLCTGADFGDYCTWFSPAEKAFINSRLRLHRAELPDLMLLRKARAGKLERVDQADRPVAALMDRHAAGYLCIGQSYFQLPLQPVLWAQMELSDPTSSRGMSDTLWHLDGRVAVVGRTDTPEAARRSAVLAWDAARAAFGPSAPPATRPAVSLTLGQQPPEGWAYDFLVRPPVPPLAADDAVAYHNFANVRKQFATNIAQGVLQEWQAATPAVLVLGGVPAAWAAERTGPPRERLTLDRPEFEFALPVLAVRAARQATRDSTDPRTFAALAVAYDGMSATNPRERRTQVLTALTRALGRYPPEEEGVKSRHTIDVLEMQCLLAHQHLRGDAPADAHLDLAARLIGQVNKQVGLATEKELDRLPVPVLWLDWLRYLGLLVQSQSGLPPEYRVSDAAFNRVLQSYPLLKPEQAAQLNAMVAEGMKTGRIPPEEERGLVLKQQVFDMFIQGEVLEKGDDLPAWLNNESAPLTAEVFRGRLKRLEESILAVVRKTNDGVVRMTRGAKPEEKCGAYVTSGLPGLALDTLTDLGDTSKSGGITLAQTAELVALLQRVGQLEEAHDRRMLLSDALGQQAAGATDPVIADLRFRHQNLELAEAKLAGDYKKADALIEEQFRGLADPPLTATEQRVATSKLMSTVEAAGVLGGGWTSYYTLATFQNLRSRLLNEAAIYYERGMFALLDGDTRLAKQHFDAAAKPQGIPLTELEVPAQQQTLTVFLPKYRELLEKYAK